MNIEKKIWKKYQSKGFPHISDPMIIDEIISDIDEVKKELADKVEGLKKKPLKSGIYSSKNLFKQYEKGGFNQAIREILKLIKN